MYNIRLLFEFDPKLGHGTGQWPAHLDDVPKKGRAPANFVWSQAKWPKSRVGKPKPKSANPKNKQSGSITFNYYNSLT